MAAKLKEPMELAKNYDPKKSLFPASAQVKYDGVPLTFKRDGAGIVKAYSRQNEVMVSVPHLVAAAGRYLSAPGASFTGECLVPGMPFKDSSGKVRSYEPCLDIVCIVFDAELFPAGQHPYRDRRTQWLQCYVDDPDRFKNKLFFAPEACIVNGPADMEAAWDRVCNMAKDPEGMMLHHLDKKFQPGKRCWGMTRYKTQPTIDLEVHSFEEAVDDRDVPMGMVGRINVRLERRYPSGMLKRSIVGVGPGKLTHKERIALWDRNGNREFGPGTIVEIKYMPDPTYDALRQPTFQRIRNDKTKADVLEYPA